MQDFTTFTESDAPGRLSQAADRSTFMGLRGNDADVFLRKAIVAAWPTDFSQEFEFYIDTADPTSGDRSVALVSYVQDLDDWEANRAANKNQVSVMVDNVAAGPAPRIAIVETNAGNVYTSAATYNPAMDTLFYCTFVKVGTVTTLYIYSDAGRTTLVATLTLTLQAGWTIVYAMAPQSNGSGDADEISGYVQDLDDPISSLELYASFTVNQWYEELYGHAEIQQETSADLYAHAIIRNVSSPELYAHAVIRNIGSVELYASFTVNQWYAELYGHAEIQQETSADLYAHALIRNINSAELYAHAIIINIGSAELYGHGIIKNIDSAQEYGHGIIRNIGSADLPCTFRITTDQWIVQGVSVEAYIALTIVI